MENKENNAVEKAKKAMEEEVSEKFGGEREEDAAKNRVKIAEIKAHEKAEKEKRKLAYKREKERRKYERKERKEARIAEKNRLKAQEKAERNQIKKMKAENEQAYREQRRKDREKRRKAGGGFGGWLAAVISLGASSLVLATVLIVTLFVPSDKDRALESGYRKSFFDTVAQVDNIDLNLSKILATSEESGLQKYLVDTAINSELAENNLSQLPLEDESKFYTAKLINQVGDYTKYLNEKLVDGEGITAGERENLYKLYKAVGQLRESLQRTVGNMTTDFSFSSMLGGGDGNLVISEFNDLQELSVEYPELIYDGPFSDGKDEREIKGLSEKTVTEEEAEKVFVDIFSGFNLKNVKSAGKGEGNLSCFNFNAEVNGDNLYAQISERDGKLIMFAYSGSCMETVIDADTAESNALKFLGTLGIENMKAVWINLANNLFTINFASENNGVIIYSDLIKIRVCAETGKIIGMEATSYYTNHTERIIPSPLLSVSAAKNKVSDNITVLTSRLAVIPFGEKTEKLSYEFSGTYDGATYYVYIDAVTGRQIEMFKVIESTEGMLLM